MPTYPPRLIACLLAALVLTSAAGCATQPHGLAPLNDDELLAHVQAVACRVAGNCADARVLLFDSPAPQAELLPDGRLALRLGLLLAIEEEAELAFVLAHELAHRALGHRPPRSIEARLPLELAADAAALARIVGLGYPADAGSRLITRLRPADPGRQQRIEAAQRQIEQRLAALPQPTSRPPRPDADWRRLTARYRAAAPVR